MPRPDIVTVIAGQRVSRGGTEIVEVWRCAAGVKFVVAGRGPRAVFDSSPRGIVAVVKLLRRARWIGVIARGKYLAGNVVDQVGGSFSAGKAGAIGDIARPYKNGIARRRV